MKQKDFLKRSGVLSLCIMAALLIFSSCTTDDVDPPVIDENEPQYAVFDFTSSDVIKGWGIAIPGGSAGTEITTIVQDGITLTTTPGTSSNHARIYATGSGVLDLRVYTSDIITLKAPEGYIITGMSWTTQNATTIDAWAPDHGSVANGTWTAPADGTVNSVSLTATGTARMNVLTVTYIKGDASIEAGSLPTPEPAAPVSLSLDFTSATVIQSLGYTVPGASSGTVLTKPIDIDDLTLTPINASTATEDTSIRLYTSKGGDTDLRIYTGDAINIKVKNGRTITSLSWTSANTSTIDAWEADSGTISGGVWQGESGKTYNSITLTATGTTRINVLSVNYE